MVVTPSDNQVRLEKADDEGEQGETADTSKAKLIITFCSRVRQPKGVTEVCKPLYM